MSNVQQQLEELINRSSSILTELRNDTPSVELIRQTMDRRESAIEQLGTIAAEFRIDALTDKQQQLINSLFDRFADINEKIETALKTELLQSREKLTSATRQRKAEDKYHVLEKPDISHF